MLLAAAEEEKEMNEGKKPGVKIGKRSKNLKQGNNNSSITPVIGIDGQRHHPCCPLAPGKHNHNHNHVHNSGSSTSSSSSGSSNSCNNNGNPGPRQYPLHTQRADSVMMWLRAIILKQEKENEAKPAFTTVTVNTNGEVKPMMNGTSMKIIHNIEA